MRSIVGHGTMSIFDVRRCAHIAIFATPTKFPNSDVASNYVLDYFFLFYFFFVQFDLIWLFFGVRFWFHFVRFFTTWWVRLWFCRLCVCVCIWYARTRSNTWGYTTIAAGEKRRKRTCASVHFVCSVFVIQNRWATNAVLCTLYASLLLQYNTIT